MSLSNLGQQLYAVSALARESLLPSVEAKILKVRKATSNCSSVVGAARAAPSTEPLDGAETGERSLSCAGLILEGDAETAAIILRGDSHSTNLRDLLEDLSHRAEREARNRLERIVRQLSPSQQGLCHAADQLSFDAATALFHTVPMRRGGRLLHLGSGCGTLILTAAMLLDIREAMGVESDDKLVKVSNSAQDTFYREQLNAGMLQEDIPRISFDALPLSEVESSRFNLVVVDQRYTESPLLGNLLAQLRSTPTGTTVVGLNASFKAPFLRLLSSRTRQLPGMSAQTVYVYRTVDEEGRATPPSSSAREDDRASQSSAVTPDGRGAGPRRVPGSGGSSRSFSAALGLPDRPMVDVGDGVEGLSAGGFVESAGVAAEPDGESDLDGDAQTGDVDETFGNGLAGLSSPQGGALLRVKRKLRRKAGSHEPAGDDAPWRNMAPPRHPSPGDIAPGPEIKSFADNEEDDDEEEEEEEEDEEEREVLGSGFEASRASDAHRPAAGSGGGSRLSRLLEEERDVESGSASPQGDALRHTKMQQAARRRAWEQQHPPGSGLATF